MTKITDCELVKKFGDVQLSASNRQKSFKVSLRKLRIIMNTTKCFYTGTPLVRGKQGNHSIDCVNPSKGYVDDNIVACDRRINALKSNLKPEEILLISKGIIKHQKKVNKTISKTTKIKKHD